MTSNNTNAMADEDMTDVLDIYFEGKAFDAGFNQFIDSEMVLQSDGDYQCKRDKTNPFFYIKLNILPCNDVELIHDSLNKCAIDVDGKPFGVSSGEILG